MGWSDRIYERVKEIANALGVEYEICDEGYVCKKGERIVKTIYNAALGLYTKAEWENVRKSIIDKLREYITNEDASTRYKVIYRVSTKHGCSRLYVIKTAR